MRIWIGVASCVFALVVALSWAGDRRRRALLESLDVRTLDASAKVLDELLVQQGKHLRSTIGVLSEDARIRAMVLTPSFDHATVLDLLTDLKATSGASLVAMLDTGGMVRAVVGAPEMDQLNLGTASLVREGLDRPSAQLWVFANEVGVLSVTPVRLDNQVRALFMMGFEIDDGQLIGIERAVGAIGAALVGDRIVASASKDPGIERALRAAAGLSPGTYQVVAGTYLAMSSPMGDAAGAATAAWLVPLNRHADEMMLARALAWLPAALVGLLLVFAIGLARASRRGSNL